jgi:hypothetical protein
MGQRGYEAGAAGESHSAADASTVSMMEGQARSNNREAIMAALQQ